MAHNAEHYRRDGGLGRTRRHDFACYDLDDPTGQGSRNAFPTLADRSTGGRY